MSDAVKSMPPCKRCGEPVTWWSMAFSPEGVVHWPGECVDADDNDAGSASDD